MKAEKRRDLVVDFSAASPNSSGGTGLDRLSFLQGGYSRTSASWNGKPVFKGPDAQKPWASWNTCGQILGEPAGLTKAVVAESPVLVFWSRNAWRVGWELSDDPCRTYGRVEDGKVVLGANNAHKGMFNRYRGGEWRCEKCKFTFSP